jgi:hypothetical protein
MDDEKDGRLVVVVRCWALVLNFILVPFSNILVRFTVNPLR